MRRDRAIVVSRDDEESSWPEAESPAPAPLYGHLADPRGLRIPGARGVQFGRALERFLAPNCRAPRPHLGRARVPHRRRRRRRRPRPFLHPTVVSRTAGFGPAAERRAGQLRCAVGLRTANYNILDPLTMGTNQVGTNHQETAPAGSGDVQTVQGSSEQTEGTTANQT